MPHPTRIADDIVDSARAEAARDGRSIAEQINHWARIGREITSHDSVGRRRLAAAMAGDLPIDDLNRSETRAFNAEVQVQLEDELRATDLGAELAAAGVVTVAVDSQGRLVEYHPDGSERILSNEQ